MAIRRKSSGAITEVGVCSAGMMVTKCSRTRRSNCDHNGLPTISNQLEAERSRLLPSHRILGSKTECGRCPPRTWLRLSRTTTIDDLPAWLLTVVTRLCLDHLRKTSTRSDAEAKTSEDVLSIDPEDDALWQRNWAERCKSSSTRWPG